MSVAAFQLQLLLAEPGDWQQLFGLGRARWYRRTLSMFLSICMSVCLSSSQMLEGRARRALPAWQAPGCWPGLEGSALPPGRDAGGSGEGSRDLLAASGLCPIASRPFSSHASGSAERPGRGRCVSVPASACAQGAACLGVCGAGEALGGNLPRLGVG